MTELELMEGQVRYRASFWKFATECLGYRKNVGVGWEDLTKEHEDLCTFLQHGDKKFKLVLMPRYSLKSCLITTAYSLWNIVRNPNIRILIYSDTATKAEGFLGDIKNHILGKGGSSLFSAFFPGYESGRLDGVWNNSQVLVSVRNVAQREPTVDTGGIESSKVGSHYDLIIFDDIVSDVNTTTKAQMDKTYECYRKSLSLLKPNGSVVMVGCLVAGSKVLLNNGCLKNIEDIKVGEKVISYVDDRVSSVETVEAMIPQGHAEVFEIRTPNRIIEATSNHPFMTPSGWKKVEELKEGDEVSTLSYLPRINHSEYTEDEMWALGLMFGDGWKTIRKDRHSSVVCIAKGTRKEINDKIKNIYETKFRFRFKETKYGYYRAENADLTKFLEKQGFCGNAKTKRVPPFVFGLSVNLRECFLGGFIDADGWVNDLFHIEVCNKELAEDIRHLAETCGYKVSNVHSRTRKTQAPHSRDIILSESHHVSFGKKKRIKRFRKERICSIRSVGIKPVFDLTVSNTHNFIANGYVVHNTRWNFGDTYGRIIDETKQTGEWGIFIKKADLGGEYPFASIGLNKDFLETQRGRIGSFLYGALYQNDPVDDSTALFKHDDFSFYGTDALDFSNLFITCCCDPAGEGEDYTAFTVVGTDKNLNMHVLYAKHAHFMPNQIVDEIVKLSYGYKFVKFGIETRIFNGMLEKELDLRLAEERKKEEFRPFSVEIFSATCRQGEGKTARIMSLQPYHERHALLFPGDSVEKLRGSFAELSSQMLQWTQTHRPMHDDLIDSLSYHVQLVRPGRGDVEKKPDESSFMAILERERLDHNRLQGRVPMRYRKYLSPVFGLLLFCFMGCCKCPEKTCNFQDDDGRGFQCHQVSVIH